MDAIRIALEEPSRSLWISEAPRGGHVIKLQDGVNFRQTIPLDVPVLVAMASGAPRECCFWTDTARLTFRWLGVITMEAEYEDDERTVRELVSMVSLGEALAALG